MGGCGAQTVNDSRHLHADQVVSQQQQDRTTRIYIDRESFSLIGFFSAGGLILQLPYCPGIELGTFEQNFSQPMLSTELCRL